MELSVMGAHCTLRRNARTVSVTYRYIGKGQGCPMPRIPIKKSLVLDSEPRLNWPRSPAKLLRQVGMKLEYWGPDATKYSLRKAKKSSVQMVKWNSSKVIGTTDLFQRSRMEPDGLRRLAALSQDPCSEKVCIWVSENGPLGLQADNESVIGYGRGIPYLALGTSLIPTMEPLDCIRAAARRAANVVKLWEALKKSYLVETGYGVECIKSVVRFAPENPFTRLTSCYRVIVNGEPRSAHPIPESLRDWRRLANVLLGEFILDHLSDNVRITLSPYKQNKDEEERSVEPAPDWNLKPTWYIGSALTAYYVELLMVLRRFRSCETCGRDISHQKTNSACCSGRCRVEKHRREKRKRRFACP
jgi:hypothetical protein